MKLKKLLKRKTIKRLVKDVFIVGLVLSWLLTGWPGLSYWGFVPDVKEVQGVTCGFGTEIGTTGVCRGFLTTAGSNQTWTTPSDWNNSNNTIECIGAGGSGGAVNQNATAVATGGGGGAYSLISNFNVADPGTTQITYQVGSGGTAVSGTSGGVAGGDSWLNNSTFPGSGTTNVYCGAKGGGVGNAGTATQNGGTGGVDTSGWGQTRRSGGSGGTAGHASTATGGGGAAGNSAIGGNGVNSSTTNSATNGGQANGTGATGGTANNAGNGNPGGDGTEYTSEGSGGGGGGGRNNANALITGGSGGKRGGGGAGAVNYRTNGTPTSQSGAGYDGIIVITYTPVALASTFTQNDFEWFVDQTSLTLTDPWPSGSIDLAENEVFTQLPATKRPLVSGDRIRIQMNVTVGTANLTSGGQAFQLEYVAAEDCTIATGWATVGALGSGTIWRFFDNTSLTDGVTQVNQISTSTTGAEGRYLESNSASWTNPNAVNTTESTEWDFAVENNGAAENTTYCFRMAKNGGTALDTYNADSYPKLTTAPGTSNQMRHGNFFQNSLERGFFWTD